MAAIEQGAPLMTIDYDFWMRLPERQYVSQDLAVLPILERILRLSRRLQSVKRPKKP